MSRVALKRTRVGRRPVVAIAYPCEWIRPCLASDAGKIPSGPRWVHEIKFDGYRTQLHLRPGRTVIYSRNGHDWTSRYQTPSIKSARNGHGSAKN